MNRQGQAPERHPDPETARLLDELIAVLAGACGDAERRFPGSPHAGMSARLSAASGMRPLAARLARCVSAGDYLGADRLLSGQRRHHEWRMLVLLLASAADHEQLESPAAVRRAA